MGCIQDKPLVAIYEEGGAKEFSDFEISDCEDDFDLYNWKCDSPCYLPPLTLPIGVIDVDAETRKTRYLKSYERHSSTDVRSAIFQKQF